MEPGVHRSATATARSPNVCAPATSAFDQRRVARRPSTPMSSRCCVEASGSSRPTARRRCCSAARSSPAIPPRFGELTLRRNELEARRPLLSLDVRKGASEERLGLLPPALGEQDLRERDPRLRRVGVRRPGHGLADGERAAPQRLDGWALSRLDLEIGEAVQRVGDLDVHDAEPAFARRERAEESLLGLRSFAQRDMDVRDEIERAAGERIGRPEGAFADLVRLPRRTHRLFVAETCEQRTRLLLELHRAHGRRRRAERGRRARGGRRRRDRWPGGSAGCHRRRRRRRAARVQRRDAGDETRRRLHRASLFDRPRAGGVSYSAKRFSSSLVRFFWCDSSVPPPISSSLASR